MIATDASLSPKSQLLNWMLPDEIVDVFVNTVAFPSQTVVAVKEATGLGCVVIIAGAVVSEGQTPLWTIATYQVVTGGLIQLCVVVVFPSGNQVAPLLIEKSQFVTGPLFPESVKVPLPVPSQTEVDPLIVPATLGGVTVIVVTDENCGGLQTPLCTTARYWVVTKTFR